MRLPFLSTCVVFSLMAPAAAQGTVISPLSCIAAEGDASNAFPFGSTTPRRYMQIHADLGATPLLITKIGFRVTASAAAYTGTRTFDMELFMGDGNPTAQQLPNLTFDANYASPKQTVLPRQFVTWGPTGQAVTPGPNPFSPALEITLATPFLYTGTAPLIWEVAMYAYTNNPVTPISFGTLDTDGSTTLTAVSTITGTGCAATGNTTPMTHTYVVNDSAGTLMMNGTITGGPANSFALMAVGFANPNAAIPGLCANLLTDLTLVQFLGLTSATGT